MLWYSSWLCRTRDSDYSQMRCIYLRQVCSFGLITPAFGLVPPALPSMLSRLTFFIWGLPADTGLCTCSSMPIGALPIPVLIR